jgi:thiol-disulfide isomerase/thioredoxin
MKRALLLLLLGSLLVACGRSQPEAAAPAEEAAPEASKAAPAKPKAAPTPKPQPGPTVERVDDLPMVDLAALKKRVTDAGAPLTLVAAWATWCAPCIEEMPTLAAFYRKHKAAGLSVMGLCMDDRSDMKDKIQEVLDRIEVPFPNLLIQEGGQETFMAAVDKGWEGSLPATLVYDESGKRVAFFMEALTQDILKRKVAPLLGR